MCLPPIEQFGLARALYVGMTLRITVHERESSIEITLEGRLAGPWVTELSKAWRETAPRLESKTLFLNLRDLTSLSEDGKQVLREIVAQTNPEILTSDPMTKHLAQEISDASRLGTGAVPVNLRDLIYGNEDGKQVLKKIAKVLTSDPATTGSHKK
jgi:hypothetical protein